MPPPMSLPAGTRLGPYEILALIGAGGMGEVYRAHDSRLGRDVAVKTCRLGGEAAADRREALRREARAVASLSHPHICAVFDVGSRDDLDYLVMELLEGQTLASRLTRGPMPLPEALATARQIADALAAAHAAGLVHRDLKPQNVMLTSHGVKLLDFGLARSLAAPDAGTTRSALTHSGIVAGTVPYMAPEQIEGRPVDGRADLFAFGATLFEMITGRPAFAGDSSASVISAILRDEPPAVSSLKDVPASLDRLVAACLAKSPDARWHCADDLRQALAWVSAERETPAVPTEPDRPSRRWLGAAAVLAAAIALIAVGRSSLGTTAGAPSPPRRVHLRIDPPKGTSLIVPDGPPGTVQLAFASDGSTLAFVATSPEGGQVLYRRRLDEPDAVRIPGTEGALFPTWSPDNRTLAFFTTTEVKTVGDSGDEPRTVGRLVQPYGGTWLDDRHLLVAGSGVLYRISLADGRMEPLAPASSNSRAFVAPLAVTGQSWFIVAEANVEAPMEAATITARAADGTLLTTMLAANSRPLPVGPQTLVFVRNWDVYAQDFDPSTGAMRGEAREVLSDVGGAAPTSSASLAASPRGDLAYARRARQQFPLRWWSRSGQVLATVADDVNTPSLSPDERYVAMRRAVPGGPAGTVDLFLVDASRGASQRVTFDAPPDSSPVWAPASDRIAYSSMREGLDDLWIKGTSPGAGIRVAQGPAIPSDWSPDGRLVAFHGTRTATGRWGWQFDLGVVDVQSPHKVTHLSETPFQEVQARFSPDGRYMAYASNESGAFEVYLQPYPPDGRRTVLSIGGGADPVWRGDGKELFYYAPDGYVMRVPMTWAPSPMPGKPERVFRLQLPALTLPYRSRFAVSRDGQRFLALEELGADPIAIHVIVNWLASAGRPWPASGGPAPRRE